MIIIIIIIIITTITQSIHSIIFKEYEFPFIEQKHLMWEITRMVETWLENKLSKGSKRIKR
jgi:hypothetical protein